MLPQDDPLARERALDSPSVESSNGSVSHANGSVRLLAGEVTDPSEEAAADSAKLASPYSVDDAEVLRHYRWQWLQRSVTSAGIGLIGVLIILSDYVKEPNVFAFGLFFTVLLILAVFASAMVDAVRTQMFFQKNDQGFREAKRELLKEYARLQAKQGHQSSERPGSLDS